jgi:hypothetical protein
MPSKPKRTKHAKKLRIPRNIIEAVNQGWQIVEQSSSWHFDGGMRPGEYFRWRDANAREGFFRLKKPRSRETLFVPFLALYDMGRPYFLGDKRP